MAWSSIKASTYTQTDTFFQSHQGQNSYKHNNGINDHAYYVATYMAQKKKKKKKDSTYVHKNYIYTTFCWLYFQSILNSSSLNSSSFSLCSLLSLFVGGQTHSNSTLVKLTLEFTRCSLHTKLIFSSCSNLIGYISLEEVSCKTPENW